MRFYKINLFYVLNCDGSGLFRFIKSVVLYKKWESFSYPQHVSSSCIKSTSEDSVILSPFVMHV